MKVVWILLVLLHFSWGVPPSRRYSYDYDSGYHAPLTADTRLGGRYADLPRPGQGDHASWCPLRARNAMRSAMQRLPVASRTKGPNYFHNPGDYGDQVPRYERSYQKDFKNDDFIEVDSSDLNEDGVDVGGIFWPRRKLQKLDIENTKPDCGCNHERVATLAMDATEAASNAATAAALAARAAAKAAAAATCGQGDIPNNQVKDEMSSDLYSTAHSGHRREYSSKDHENDYQGNDENFQDESGLLNSHDNELPRHKVSSTENSQGWSNEEDLSPGTTRREVDSLMKTVEGTDSEERNDDKGSFPTGGEISHYSNKISPTRVMNSLGVSDDWKPYKEFSQGKNGGNVLPNRELSGVSSQGLSYHGILYPQHNARSTPNNGKTFQGTSNDEMHSLNRTGGVVNSQGANSSQGNSQGSVGKDINPQVSSVSLKNSVDDKNSGGVNDQTDELKKIAERGSNVQSIPLHVERSDS